MKDIEPTQKHTLHLYAGDFDRLHQLGAAGGLGRAFALGFASRGANVVVADMNEAGSAETVALIEASGGKAIAVKTNVTDKASCEAVADAAVAGRGRALWRRWISRRPGAICWTPGRDCHGTLSRTRRRGPVHAHFSLVDRQGHRRCNASCA